MRTAVSTALNTRFAMLLMWGPDLVMVYNDAYAPMLGLRHPVPWGSGCRDVWVDVWADIEPMIDEVFAGGVTYFEDLPLTMTRHGFDEECYFTFSYSAVVEPGGRWPACSTPSSRRLTAYSPPVGWACSRSWAASRARRTAAPPLGRRAALAVLAEARTDCPFGLVYLADEARSTSASWPGTASPTAGSRGARSRSRSGGHGHWCRPHRHRAGPPAARPCSTGASPAGEDDVHTAVVLPLTAVGRTSRRRGRPGVSPHLRLDDDTGCFSRLRPARSAPPWPTPRRSRSNAVARTRGPRSTAPARSSSPRSPSPCSAPSSVPTVLPDGFAVHYEPATGTLEVGGDWYDVVDLPGRPLRRRRR